MTYSNDKEYKTNLTMYATNRRMCICANPMEEGDECTYNCEQCENGKPACDRRFLFSQSLDP